MQPRLDQAQASVATAERRLADLVAGARAREVEDARATLSGAESALRASQRGARTSSPISSGPI